MFVLLVTETHWTLCLVLYVCTSWKRLGVKVDKDSVVKSFWILNSWMSVWFSHLSFNSNNPVSLYNSLKGVNFVPPDIILIASTWTYSNILIKYRSMLLCDVFHKGKKSISVTSNLAKMLFVKTILSNYTTSNMFTHNIEYA